MSLIQWADSPQRKHLDTSQPLQKIFEYITTLQRTFWSLKHNLSFLEKLSQSKWQFVLIKKDLAMNIQRLLAYNLVKLEIPSPFHQTSNEFSFLSKLTWNIYNVLANIFRRVLPIYLMSMRFSNINRWQWWWRSRDGYFWQMRWYQYPSRYRAFGRDRDRRLLSFPQNLSDDEGKSQQERTKLCLIKTKLLCQSGGVCVCFTIFEGVASL